MQTDRYETVHMGATAAAFEKRARGVLRDIEVEREWHAELAVHRAGALLVPWVADTLGRTTFPPIAVWDAPHKLAVEALGLRNAGRMADAETKLKAARWLTDKLSRRLTTYADKTSQGARIGLGVARVAAAAAAVAELARGTGLIRKLVSTGLRKGPAKKLVRKTAKELSKSKAKKRTPQEVANERARVLERHHDEAVHEELRSMQVVKDRRLGDRQQSVGAVKGGGRGGEGFAKW